MNGMSAHALPRLWSRQTARGRLALIFALVVALVVAGVAFVSYVLWPTWPRRTVALDAPTMPVTVAGVLFEIPPSAIRAAVQRYSGPHDRIDLAFAWPSLGPRISAETPAGPAAGEDATAATPRELDDRLFVTIAGLGSEMAPLDRLRSIYPHYVAATATAGPDGLAILPFRAGTPYDGEDLVYLGTDPAQFFARCTRSAGAVPGTCMAERMVNAADVTFRFPRNWLGDWRGVAAGFGRLVAQLRPDSG